MSPNKQNFAHSLKSDLLKSDARRVDPSDLEELPELTDAMLAKGVVRRAGRPSAKDPRRQVTIRLPESVLAAWKATGPGWQTRMAELLGKRLS